MFSHDSRIVGAHQLASAKENGPNLGYPPPMMNTKQLFGGTSTRCSLWQDLSHRNGRLRMICGVRRQSRDRSED
jgi:hypothetical protein